MATYVSKFTGAQIDQRLEMAEQVPNKADKSELPSKVSDLVNDSGFISETQKITDGGASKTVPEILVQTVENTTAIITEKNRAEEAEGALGTAINNERTRAQGAEQDNANAIATEKSRAEGAEAAMNAKISALEASKYKVVEVLPETGETNVIYLVPSPRPSQKNIKDEFIWVDGAWEQIGSTEIDLSDYAHKGEVRHIERDLGMYPELEPLPLNSEVTGKYINSEGKYVDASDWNIASIGAVSLGNTYLLNMVSSANMVLGVALFVSRVYKRDKEGKIIGTTLTPLFSAKNTSIPASGYVLFEAMDDYDDVLICYKPALTTQMLVARWGFKASHATQLRNLRLVVDNKTDFEGIYELLTAGYALNLVGKGNGEPQAFLSRKTGGGNITDGSAVIKEVDGVKPIVWNQLVKKTTQEETTYNGLTFYPQENGEVLITGVATETSYASMAHYLGYAYESVANHKAFVQIFGDATRTMELYVTDDRQIMTDLGIVQWGTVAAGAVLYIPKGYDCGQGVRLRFIVNDLTQMFSAGNEPSTYEEYLDRISHYHIKDAYAYNAGEIVNYRGTGIKTTGRNLWDEEWENGYIDVNHGGADTPLSTTFRSKNYTSIPSEATLYVNRGGYNAPLTIAEYNAEKEYIRFKVVSSNGTIKMPSDVAFIRFYLEPNANTSIYNHDICINLSDPAFNGQYEPYKSYVRDWSEVMKKYFPDGMTNLNGVKDFFNDKKAVRKYGVVDLGEFEWDAYSANRFRTRTDIEDIKLTDSTTVANIFAPNYKAVRKEWVEQTDMQISVDGRYIMVCHRSVADATALKAAMQGVKLYYELSEPVEDIFDKPLNLTYTVINGGTETSLATENSTQFESSIFYGKDYVGVIDELQLQNRVTQIEFENWEN